MSRWDSLLKDRGYKVNEESMYPSKPKPEKQFDLFAQPDELDVALDSVPSPPNDPNDAMKNSVMGFCQLYLFHNIGSYEKIAEWVDTPKKVFSGMSPKAFALHEKRGFRAWQILVIDAEIDKETRKRKVSEDLLK